jgi:hypothetical protein
MGAVAGGRRARGADPGGDRWIVTPAAAPSKPSPSPTTRTAGERLRAIEALREFECDAELPFARTVAQIPREQLDAELDQVLAGFFLPKVEARFPLVAAELRAEAERRAREIADADRIEAEVERRAAEIAEERARELVAARLRELNAGDRLYASEAVGGLETHRSPDG